MAQVFSLVCWGGALGKSVTVSNTTDLVTLTNHGLRDATGVAFTSGTLPTVSGTALALNTTYYAKSISSSTYELYYDAVLTSKIDFTSTGSSLVMKSAYYLALSDKSRWTTGGVERIYDGLAGWISGRSGALTTDEEICEIGQAFTDVGTATRTVNIPSGRNVITTEVNGSRSGAFHGGVFGAGYIASYNGASFSGISLSRLGDMIDGVEINQTNTGYALSTGLNLGASVIAKNMLIRSASTNTTTGVRNTGTAAEIHNSVVTGFAKGFDQDAYQSFFKFTNCVAYGNTNGFTYNSSGGSAGNKAYVFNCVSLGNTTNWQASATDLTAATNNLGGTGEAWVKSPGIRIETTDTAPFSATFTSTSTLDLSPASVTSTLVENGTEFFGNLLTDIDGSVRPSYPGSAYNTAVTAGSFIPGLSYTIASVGTTDFTLIGASANTVGVTFKATGAGTDTDTGTATLNAKLDIGAYEFDLGYGTWPSTDYYGLAFTGLVSGSKVKVFTTGTDTELFSTADSSTSETWSVNSSSSATVDYVILKAGYEPIRVTGITVTGGADGVVTTPIAQVIARWYQASSGLTINTNCFADASTKKFGLTAASTLQNFASYLLEQWIALGDTTESYANKPFPIAANGPNSFSWLAGWEADLTTYPNTITNLSRDGMRYLNTSGVATASWAAILSVGVPSGARVRYQQTDGGTTQNAAVTSGNMDQLVQIYGDATHGNFDYTGYLVLKVQEQGYDQVEADAVSLYGTLEDQLYVVGLTPTANGVAAANPTISDLTITDHGASPVTWNSKQFSITITDAGTTSGTHILQAIRYAQETGGTFQGKDAFNWHDLVQTNGDKFKGVRGKLYGDTGAAMKGVRVLRGADAHPDVTLHTADDGTTYSSVSAGKQSVTINGLTIGSRVQIYDTTNSTELKNEIAAGTSVSWVDTLDPVGNRAIRVRIAYVSGTSAKKFIEASIGTCGTSAETVAVAYLASQQDDATYNSNAINGSTVTGVTLTDSATDVMNLNLAGGTISLASMYAAWVYYASTEAGIRTDIDYIEAIDPANYVYSNLLWKNTSSPSVPLKITGGYAWDSATLDPVDLVDTAGGTIFLAPPHVVSKVVTVGGVNVITGDIGDIPTAGENAAAVLAAAQATPIHSHPQGPVLDLAKINGLVSGTPATVTAASRTAGDVSQTISESSGTVTVTRQ